MTAGAARQEYSAGGVVIHRQAGESRCLVIRDGHRNWGFPKGHIEPGETAERAAIREVVEETGIREPVIRTRLDTLEWDFMNSGEGCTRRATSISWKRLTPRRSPSTTKAFRRAGG